MKGDAGTLLSRLRPWPFIASLHHAAAAAQLPAARHLGGVGTAIAGAAAGARVGFAGLHQPQTCLIP